MADGDLSTKFTVRVGDAESILVNYGASYTGVVPVKKDGQSSVTLNNGDAFSLAFGLLVTDTPPVTDAKGNTSQQYPKTDKFVSVNLSGSIMGTQGQILAQGGVTHYWNERLYLTFTAGVGPSARKVASAESHQEKKISPAYQNWEKSKAKWDEYNRRLESAKAQNKAINEKFGTNIPFDPANYNLGIRPPDPGITPPPKFMYRTTLEPSATNTTVNWGLYASASVMVVYKPDLSKVVPKIVKATGSDWIAFTANATVNGQIFGNSTGKKPGDVVQGGNWVEASFGASLCLLIPKIQDKAVPCVGPVWTFMNGANMATSHYRGVTVSIGSPL